MMHLPVSPLNRFARLAVCAWALALGLPTLAQNAADDRVVQAREALRKKDKAALSAAVASTANHPLAQWVAYWELTNRLNTATVEELEAFYARWPQTYVEDRLRNDWLLELGRRRDWAAFAKDFPRFRMNDDREVTCYALLTQHLAGQPVRDAARAAWMAQRDGDDGCQLMATTLYGAGVLNAQDAWHKARLSVEFNRPRNARHAAGLVNARLANDVGEAFDNPIRWLARRPHGHGADAAEVATLALIRLANTDNDLAIAQAQEYQGQLPRAHAALAWAAVGKQAAMKLQGNAVPAYERALELSSSAASEQRARVIWSADTLQWMARAALRTAMPASARHRLVHAAVEALPEHERADGTWAFWQARTALQAAPKGEAGEAQRQAARAQLEAMASPLHFYGALANEELGRPHRLPPVPAAPTAAEREAVRTHAGMGRALKLIAIGLRHEGVREWNYSLRGMSDRELLAAAQRACEAEVWDRCINTSERSRNEIDVAQRFPTPFRERVQASAHAAGLDPAYVFGLIRQESRFIPDIRSHVGASGLMQVMPATASWTAKRVNMPFTAPQITDIDTNLRIGTTYLKMVLEDLSGSQAMAAAAYNAGPNRPRRWREGGTVEAAAWAENIPFNETRDYVKKVLSNALVYSLVLGHEKPPTLSTRLGPAIGPREAKAAPPNTELP
jgi:soluble lytic murein transglycosylase